MDVPIKFSRPEGSSNAIDETKTVAQEVQLVNSKIDSLNKKIDALEGQLSSLHHAVACIYKQASMCVQLSQQNLAVHGQSYMLSPEWVRLTVLLLSAC